MKLANGAIEAAKVIDFYNNGTLCTCLENIEQIVCGIQKVENINHFELTDKGWQKVSE